MTLAAIGFVLAAFAVLISGVSGAAGWLSLAFWLAAAAPGVPLARRALGGHAASWIVGPAAGYAVTCLAVWAAVALGLRSAWGFAAVWVLECAVMALAAWRVRHPLVELRPWARRDTLAFCAVLLLVPVLMGAPFRNLGAEDSNGRRYYRAYFTADFVWHMALTAELARLEMPPRNPYLAERHLNYYWTYFLVPAAVTATVPVIDTETALEVNAIATASLLLSAIFLFAWTSGARAAAIAIGVILVVLCASAEGFWEIRDLWARGRSIDALRYMNVDAVTAWRFNGLRIDGVHRTMYYTPQHGLSCTLGLLGLAVAIVSGSRGRIGAAVLAGVLLGLSTTLNPFLGAAFSLMYGLVVAWDGLVQRRLVAGLATHAVAALPPLLAVAWSTSNAMAEGAGEALRLGWLEYARNAPLRTLLLSLGPVLIPGLVGLLPDRRLPGQPARAAAVALAVGLFLLYFVVLSDKSWVGFRAGQILLVALTLPLARLFDRLFAARQRALAAALGLTVAVLGLPTTAADAYNASDISNLRMGPGFPWTITVSPLERDGIAWIRQNTSRDAVVQMEPVRRGRAHWSFIPSFAERRMAAGLPISLLPQPIYRTRSGEARRIFDSAAASEAHGVADALGVDYVWVDAGDRAAYPAGTDQLDRQPELFQPVFRNDEVTIYAIR
jgi:hypothetical protein